MSFVLVRYTLILHAPLPPILSSRRSSAEMVPKADGRQLRLGEGELKEDHALAKPVLAAPAASSGFTRSFNSLLGLKYGIRFAGTSTRSGLRIPADELTPPGYWQRVPLVSSPSGFPGSPSIQGTALKYS